jgi:ferredoxin--NADP+ reductase
MRTGSKFNVAIIGAGPAGIFAAKELVKNGIDVHLINRDIKPGGLAEYGIYPDKHKMKEGLRKQFASCIDASEVTYYGNILVGSNGHMKIDEIRKAGFDAILATIGAQGTKWLGVPGEDLKGVYHAKDIVYHYNQLPPFSTKKYDIGKKVLIIGVGNVMMDIARYLIHEKQVESVIAIARRGPAELKFSRKEMEYVGNNFDLDEYKKELERVTPLMKEIGQDPNQSLNFILDSLENNCEEQVSNTKFQLKFLASLIRIRGDKKNNITGIELEENKLGVANGNTFAVGTGIRDIICCDTLIFAIGDGVDPGFGLPVEKNEFVKNPNPRFPIEGVSYESYDPISNQPIIDVFLAGWARKASDGLVGIARKDGVNAAQSILAYLAGKKCPNEFDSDIFEQIICDSNPHYVTKEDIKILEEEEHRMAVECGLLHFKFSTNTEMLSVIEHKKMLQT